MTIEETSAVKEAIEKQIIRKPQRFYKQYQCVCGHIIDEMVDKGTYISIENGYPSYCGKCGQQLHL